MSFLATIGAVLVARTVGKVIQKVSSQIFPFSSSSEKEKIDYNHEFQVKLQEQGFKNQKEIAYMSAMLARQTSYLNNVQNAQNALKNEMFRDVLRNYPLNIPPLVMLENAGIGTNSIINTVLGKQVNLTEKDKAIENFKRELKANPIALSVFVTPLQVDSRVANKEKISATVWDTVYQKVESMFINEYSRNGERPVVFFPSAWNPNAKPGLHAAEIIYFFAKEMPVAVIEPRFDGKHLRIMFSCWGIGLENNKHIRQEIVIDIDWNEIIMEASYERSVRGLNELKTIKELSPILLDIQKRMEHNKTMYESLKQIIEKNQFGDISDDCTKLFYTNSNDLSVISDTISATLGMTLSVLSDIHHLLATQVKPIFPFIKDKYFEPILNSMLPRDRQQFYDSVLPSYKQIYDKLILELPSNRALEYGEIEEEMLKEKERESIIKLLTVNETNTTYDTYSETIPEKENKETVLSNISKILSKWCIENDVKFTSIEAVLNLLKNSEKQDDKNKVEELKILYEQINENNLVDLLNN
jgi:hypothetical protein